MPAKTKKRACVPPSQPTKRICVTPEHKSAMVVQKAWRHSFRSKQTHYVVQAFLERGPNVNHVKSIRYVACPLLVLQRC